MKTSPLSLDTGTPENAQNVLDVIDAALDEHGEWLNQWHRAVVCGIGPAREVISDNAHLISRFGFWFDLNKDRGLVNQAAFRALARAQADCYAFGRELAGRAADREVVPVEDYDALIGKSQRFVTLARRIQDAFRKAISELDPLTGLHNRQIMLPELERERQRALRTGSPCTVAIADIDHFKQVNDTHGHAVGDEVLATTAGRFVSGLRPYDVVYRYGGEEFLICLPNTDSGTARQVLERLRRLIESEPMRIAKGDILPVTVSFGLAQIVEDASLKDVMVRADQALYAAKRGGRNQVREWSGELADRPRGNPE